MALDMGVEWAIIGHSERRWVFGETDKVFSIFKDSLLNYFAECLSYAYLYIVVFIYDNTHTHTHTHIYVYIYIYIYIYIFKILQI